jgi:hypothetical protein
LADPRVDGDLKATIVREEAVAVPADMIAIGDPFVRAESADQDGVFQYEWGWRPVHGKPPFTDFVLTASIKAGSAHGRKFNRSFIDGHLEWEDLRKPFVPSDDYLRRWNNDHEPHRNLWFTFGGG